MAPKSPTNGQRKNGQWSAVELQKALLRIRKKEISVNKASQVYGIPRRTLRDYVKNGTTARKRVGRETVLNPEQESELKNRIFRLCDLGFPLTHKAVRRAVYQFCEEYEIENQFNREQKIAGMSMCCKKKT